MLTVEFDASAAGTAGGTLSFGVPGAAGTYATELAAYSGDTASYAFTSYAFTSYAWPDAPPALPAPDEPTATSPVAAPTFDGRPFDFSQDPAYESAIQAFKPTHSVESCRWI